MRSEDRYRRAAAASGVGIWNWDLATGEFFLDPILKEMLGYEDREIRNHRDDWERLVHPDDAAAVLELARAASSFATVCAAKQPQYRSF